MAKSIMVSACLLGLPTRYDGDHNRCEEIIAYLRREGLTAVPICPEQLAGLPTPRPKAWFTEGDGAAIIDGRGNMTNEDGNNMTSTFLRGAQMSLEIARLSNCETAILKQRSPSCGTETVYRSSERVSGIGVTAALLARNNLEILSEDDFIQD